MATIDHPDLGTLGYRTSGEGSTALVLLHGWAGSAAYFDPLIGHLDPDLFYCVSLDLPGHGASGEPRAPYTLELIDDATIAVADAARADTFVLLGFSMSAKFVQYVALRHPDRTVGQVLVAGCPAGQIPLPEELLDDWYSRAGDAARLIDLSLSCATRPIADDVLEAFGRDAARVTRGVLEDTMNLVRDSDFSAQVTGSTVPTLIVGGSKDWIFPPEAMRAGVAAPLARAEVQDLDCGHEIPVEAAEELADLVSQFVRDVRPG